MDIVDKINGYTIELVNDSYDTFHNLVTASKIDAKDNTTFPLIEALETTDKKDWRSGKLRPLVNQIRVAIHEAVNEQINVDNEDAPITEEIEDAQEDIEDELLDAVMEKLKKDIKEKVPRPHPKKEGGIKAVDLEDLEMFFSSALGGIKYQHQQVNLDIMQSPLDPTLLSGQPTQKTFNRRKDKNAWIDGMGVLKDEEKYPVIVANLKIIEDSLTETKQIIPDSRNQYLNIHIQSNINTLMGQLPQYTKAEKKIIYTYWQGISNKFEDFAKKGNELSTLLKRTNELSDKGRMEFSGEGAKDRAQMKQYKDANFEENWKRMKTSRIGNYVTKFDKIAVVNDKDEETALKILMAFLNRRNAGLILDEDEYQRTQEEEELKEEEELAREVEEDRHSVDASKTLGAKEAPLSKEFAKAFKEVDILSAMYIDSFLGGAIVNNKSEKENIIEILNTHKGNIIIPDKDSADLSSLIEDLKEIEIYHNNTYAPIQIMDMKYLSSNYSGDGATRIIRSKENAKFAKNYSNVNEIYLELFDNIAKLITVSLGRGLSNIHAPTYTNIDTKTGKAKDKGRYSQIGLSRATVFKDPNANRPLTSEQNELLEALHTFIKSIDEYIITPILNSEMNMGIPFEFTSSVGFQTVVRYLKKHHSAISVDATQINPDLTLFSALHDAHEERGGAQASSSDLTAIKAFLVLLSKDFMFSDLVKKTVNLAIALFNISNNLKWTPTEKEQAQNNIETELAAFIGGVAKDIGRTLTDDDKFHGKNPKEEYEKTRINQIGQIKSFVMIKNFIIANKKGLKAGLYDRVDEIVALFNRLRKSDDIASKILSAHDSFRIIKGMPVYYGLKSPYCFDGMNNSIDSIKNKFAVDITAMEVNYILEEIDSFSNIAKSVGVSEELVYYVKADFR